MTYLFVDTNVLLHYRRLEEIDWLTLSKSSDAAIVLCPAVIRELDHHKVSHPQNKFRKRAQEIIASLHPRLLGTNSDVIRNGVRLEFLAEDPSVDFEAHKLRTELADDWIIASVLEWRQKHPDDETRIVSADLGISIKAKAQLIWVLVPFEADKLTEELDADEKRIKKLQEELTELKNSLPDLKLCFENTEQLHRIRLQPPTPPDAAATEMEMQQIRSKHPLYEVPAESTKPAKVIRTVGDLEKFQKLLQKGGKVEMVWPREELLRYNSSLDAFYAKYREYLEARHAYRNLERRRIQFEIHLENSGSKPAEDVDIHLHFPDGFQLFEVGSNALPKSPEPPSPPPKLGTFGFSHPGFDALRNIGSLGFTPRHAGPPPNVSSPSIKRTNSYDVRSHVNNAKHGYTLRVAKFTAIFENYRSAGSFRIDYSISAANLPKAADGQLSVVVEKA